MTTYSRQLTIDASRAKDDERTAPATLSTEFAVERGNFKEVLSHANGAVDLSRAPLPLIESHDGSKLNIGIVEQLRIEGRKLRGLVRLGNSARATEVWNDITSGIVRNLSIGYEWLDYRNESDDVVRVVKWRPHELSLTAIGADPHAGLYRSQSNINGDTPMTTENTETQEKQTRSQQRAETRGATQERERIASIRNMFNVYVEHDPDVRNDASFQKRASDMAERCVAEGRSVNVFGDWMNDNKPVQEMGRIMTADQLRPATGGNYNAQDKDASAYRSGQWLRAQILGHEGAQEWCRNNGLHIRAMGGTVGSAGGFLVPDELSNDIIRLVEEYGVARQECRVVTMASDHLEIPRRIGGLTAYYVGENTEITDSDASWDLIGLNARKLAVLSRYSSELAEDNVVDLGNWLAQEIAWGFAQAEDAALFNGDGSSTYGGIQGINNKILGLAGAVDAATGHDLFSEIDAVDLATLKAALPGYAQSRAKWYVSSAGYALVFERLSAAAGGNTLMSLADGQRLSFLGHEIVITESMPTSTGTLVNESMLLFGDMEAAVTFGSRRDVRIAVDESRYFEIDQLAIRGTTRYDLVFHGQGDSTTAGPIVSLVGA